MKYWTVDLENYVTHVKVSVFEIVAGSASEATWKALSVMKDTAEWTVTGVDLTDETDTQH